MGYIINDKEQIEIPSHGVVFTFANEGIEYKRMGRISLDARNAINMLIENADNMWWTGNYPLQCKANDLYIIAEKIYRKEVLYRKFN